MNPREPNWHEGLSEPCPHCDDWGWIEYTHIKIVPDPSDPTGQTPMPEPELIRVPCVCSARKAP